MGIIVLISAIVIAIGTTGVEIFNLTNNHEQNQAQEKQDVPVSPKPNMSISPKPKQIEWISVGPNISIPSKQGPPTEWWESLEFFKQLKARGDRGISDDTIKLVETIADSLVVNESFKRASVQVSIPFVRNNEKCEIVEIKRVFEAPTFLPSVNGSMYLPEREEVSVKIRRDEG